MNPAKVLPSRSMPPGDPQRPAPSRRPSDAPPSQSQGASADPSHDLAAALHEISNALTVLLGWADAARASADPKAIATALDVVASRAAHARDIARRAIGGATATPAPSPVDALIHDAAHALTMEARRAQVTLVVHVEPEVAGLPIASAPSLVQVLTNLLLNALAFSPPGSEVRIEAQAGPHDHVLVRVEDQGPGIPEAMRDRLFEGGVSSRRGGAGIGLRHSAALAATSGGELRLAEAARRTRGTCFELRWPVAIEDAAENVVSGERPSWSEPHAAAARSAIDAPSGPPSKRTPSVIPESAPRPVAERHAIDGARILVVEDDDAVIELLELALEARGASVVSVKVRDDLPRALASGAFDAALLDMSPLLGDVDGAVEALRRASPGARLVVMSGSVPQADIGAADVWIRKPFEVREIVDALTASPKPRP